MLTAFLLALLAACRMATAPCATETRYAGRYQQWNVVCLEPVGNEQTCVVWPTPPPAPAWVGQPDSMVAHGYPLRPVVVCTDLRITDTPR